MMGVGTWLARLFAGIPAWAYAAATALAIILGLLALVHHKDAAIDALRASNAVLSASVTAMQVDADAKDKASVERTGDAEAVAAIRKGLRDAIKDIPAGAAPGAATAAVNCQRLRNAGFSGADLPAGCRHADGR